MVTKPYRYPLALFVLFAVFVLLIFLPLLVDRPLLASLTEEDGILQSLTAGYLFAASILFFVAFFRFRRSSWLLRLSYLILALLLLAGAATELSLTRRIVEFDVPDYLVTTDAQTNLSVRNLDAIEGIQSVLAANFGEWLRIIVFAFALVLPLLCRIFPKIGNALGTILPVVPWGAGAFVLLTYAFEKWSVQVPALLPLDYQYPLPSAAQVDKLSVHAYALALMIAVIFYFMIQSDKKKKEDSEQLLRELTYHRR